MFMKKMKKSILRNIFESRNYILTRLVHFVQQKIKLEIQINLHVYGVNKLTLHTRCGIHLQLSAIYALMFNCVPAFSRVIGQFNLQHLLPIKYLMQLVSRRFVIYTFSMFPALSKMSHAIYVWRHFPNATIYILDQSSPLLCMLYVTCLL